MNTAVLETGSPPYDLIKRFGSYPAMFENLLGLDHLARFAVTQGDWPARVEDFDAYLITGSPAGVYDPYPWIRALKGWLRQAKGRAALVGICFGHQIMAEAFGGHVIKSPNGWGVGLQRYELVEAQPWMDHAAGFSIPASHQDQVVIKPPRAEVVAASAFTPFAALAYGDQPAISFQGHPEFDPAYAQALLRARRGTRLGEAQADAAIASLDQANDCQQVGGWIRGFLHQAKVESRTP
jgi:GMP synthase-like glutamine amidotransferase